MIQKILYKRKICDTSITNNADTENDNKDNFKTLKEEYTNETFEGNNNTESKDVYITNGGLIRENIVNQIEDDDENKKDELNTTGDFQHSFDEKDEKNEENNNNANNGNNSNNNKVINNDDIYTFGGLNIKHNFDIVNSKDKEIAKNDTYENKKINDVISKKEEKWNMFIIKLTIIIISKIILIIIELIKKQIYN